jgi:hypothetical protein
MPRNYSVCMAGVVVVVYVSLSVHEVTKRSNVPAVKRLGKSDQSWAHEAVWSVSELPGRFLTPQDPNSTRHLCKDPRATSWQAGCPAAMAVKETWGIGADQYRQKECEQIEACIQNMYAVVAAFFASEKITEWWIDAGSLIALARHHGNVLIPWDNDADIGVIVDQHISGALRPHNFVTTLMRFNSFARNHGAFAMEECAPSYNKKGVQDTMCSTTFKVHPGPPERGPGSQWVPMFKLRGPAVLDIFPYEIKGGRAHVLTSYQKWQSMWYDKDDIVPTRTCSDMFNNVSIQSLRCPHSPGTYLDSVYGNRRSWCVPKASKNFWGVKGKKNGYKK